MPINGIMMKSLLAALKESMEHAGLLEGSYLVGGTVRDILLGREIKDIDIVIKGNPVSFAKIFAGVIHGTLVPLHDEFPTARVVKKEWIFDFAALKEDSIDCDLLSRDFTINAMAIPLSGLSSASPGNIKRPDKEVDSRFRNDGIYYLDKRLIIDVTGGKADLATGVVRMVSSENLVADPLRMLRAYRFASQLGFYIDTGTMAAISSLKGLLPRAAAERIWSEIKAIFSAGNSAGPLKQMVESGLLFEIIPEIKPEALSHAGGNGAPLEHALNVYDGVEKIMERLNGNLPFPERFKLYLHSGTGIKALLKFAVLLGEAAPGFSQDAPLVERICQRLRASQKETAYIVKLIVNRPRGVALGQFTSGKRAMVELLNALGEELYALLIIGLSWEKTRNPAPAHPPKVEKGSLSIDTYLAHAENLIIFYTAQYLPRASRARFISGRDLMEIFGLKPSPLFKEILEEITDRTLEGTITGKEQAIDEVQALLSKRPQARG
ncbi:MAG: CCA tRNA nucleotidyltransferase [Nitrospirae bacterium]|nr:CCA tRNA nucleotidyltransferase [Nitrospirota bacterium]